MKYYPADIEAHLGFDQIRELLLSFCHSQKGLALAQRIKPSAQKQEIEQWHQEVSEMMQLKASTEVKVKYDFPDFEELLIRIKVPGSFLDPEAFHELKRAIYSILSWVDFLEKNGSSHPALASLTKGFELDAQLASEIDRVIDERGDVRDHASRELADIRSRIGKSERSVRSAIQRVLKKAKDDSFVEEDSTLTVREGRLVIPVKSEFKRRIQGFVHDESATGQTVFLEPGEVLELNNQVQELRYAEKREVTRILVELSDQIRENLQALFEAVEVLQKLDVIHAKALLAKEINGLVPSFTERATVEIVGGKHPLLLLKHKGLNKKVVPLDLKLDRENRILIISGPNAGGKSVALKTVGLLQYMFQTGLPVSVKEESEFGIFSSFFIDIGDTQSIEDDLSTYSAHLTAMRHFLEEVDKKSLFLIDEFGKGTEPRFGGAIAEAVMHTLNEHKAIGIVTTHYQNLKKAGDETPGLLNGAMKYDLDLLEPLFQLDIGKPGSSFAFEIAKKIGLPSSIVGTAKKKVGGDHVEYDQLLAQLEKEKAKAEKAAKKLHQEQEDLLKLRKDYEDLKAMLETEQKRLIKEAKQEAKHIIENANKEVEKTIRTIKENNASKKQTQIARERLQKQKKAFEESKPRPIFQFKEGDAVKVEGQDSTGIIQKVNGKQAEVLFGALKSIVSTSKLIKVEATIQQRNYNKIKKLGIDVSSRMASFSQELSIRGERAEVAMGRVESYIDEAILLGLNEVRIVHGKGHGVLREMVRNVAKGHPGISSVADEHPDRGGAGISIVALK
ncbi:MAG: endonuclease MutS2 [Bacteroidota bacterium]